MALRDRWNDLLPGGERLADDLVGRYTRRDRQAYRNQYLEVVLTAVDSLEQLSTDHIAVRLAAWFHRAVHEPGWSPAQDAEASAALAEELLPTHAVSAARTAEVARLVRLTGSTSSAARPKEQDPNADVLLDAVHAALAVEPAQYANHAAAVRRDRRQDFEARHAELKALIAGPIYRTQLAEGRYGATARTNLGTELAELDDALPAPWRGWQRAALTAVATFGALFAAAFALSAAGSPWSVPIGSDSAVLPVIVAVVALGLSVLLYRCGRSEKRWARLVSLAVAVAAATGLLVAWLLVPATTRSNGIGQRVPLLITALGLVLLGAFAAMVATTRRSASVRNRGQVLAWMTVPVVMVLLLVFVVTPLQRAYLLAGNERLDGPAGPAGAAPRSELTGELSWSSYLRDTRGDAFRRAIQTRYGIAIARKSSTVEMLDPATGHVRWTYSRSDADGSAELFATSEGRQVIASFDGLGYLVLDADTGRRVAAWPNGTRDHDIDNADPLLTGEDVSKGSNMLRGVNPDGKARWTFKPGRCITINAVATADTAVANLERSCGDPDDLTGLDLKTGKQLWTRQADWINSPAVAGGLVVGIESRGASNGAKRGDLVGVEARTGEVKWRWTVPPTKDCPTELTTAGDVVLVVGCAGAAARPFRTLVAAIDYRTGKTAWEQTATTETNSRTAVTTDGRVILLTETSGHCMMDVVEQSGQRRVQLPAAVRCARGAVALGNQVLVSGDDTVIALR